MRKIEIEGQFETECLEEGIDEDGFEAKKYNFNPHGAELFKMQNIRKLKDSVCRTRVNSL